MNKFKENALKIIKDIKNEKFNQFLPQKLPIYDNRGLLIALLKPVTKNSINKLHEIKLLAKWREENSFAFPTQFKVTLVGTKKWTKGLIKDTTRILFFVEMNSKASLLVGHMGLYTFNFKEKSCEIDNVVRGIKSIYKGIMSLALDSLINWTQQTLNPKKIYLKVLSDNKHAIKFYVQNGFKKVGLVTIEDSKKKYLKMKYQQ